MVTASALKSGVGRFRLAPSWGSVAMVVFPSVIWNRLCPCHVMWSMRDCSVSVFLCFVMCVGLVGIHGVLFFRFVFCFMEMDGGALVFGEGCSCLECQHLFRPNPVEDRFICLRSLEVVGHELDLPVECDGFEELLLCWVPVIG